MDQERRRQPRYSRADLELDVARPGIKGILALNPTVECLNFSITGLQFGAEDSFKVGERLILDLRVFEIQARELRSQVVSCEYNTEAGLWCTSVRFCFEDKSMQGEEINHALLQIEDKLRIANEFPVAGVSAMN